MWKLCVKAGKDTAVWQLLDTGHTLLRPYGGTPAASAGLDTAPLRGGLT